MTTETSANAQAALPTLRIKRRGEQINLFAAAAIFLVIGLLFAAGLLSSRRGGGDASVGAGYFLIAMSIIPIVWAFIVAKRGPDELIFSPTGLHDPQLFDREIPWSEFSAMDITNTPKPTINFRCSKDSLTAVSFTMIGKLLHSTGGKGKGIGYSNVHFTDTFAEVVEEIDIYMADLAAANGGSLFGAPQNS